jgi:hypothetical protein
LATPAMPTFRSIGGMDLESRTASELLNKEAVVVQERMLEFARGRVSVIMATD